MFLFSISILIAFFFIFVLFIPFVSLEEKKYFDASYKLSFEEQKALIAEKLEEVKEDFDTGKIEQDDYDLLSGELKKKLLRIAKEHH